MPNLLTLYQIYCHLTASQKQSILKQLQAKGYNLVYIQAKQYTPDSEVGTHFFFYETEDAEPKRYWEISEEMWQDFQKGLLPNQ